MKDIDLMDLQGEPRARGHAYGVARRARIESCLKDWLESFRVIGIPDPQAYLTGMLRDTDFVDSIRTHAADLLEEVRGIAEGSGQPFEMLLAAQLMDEEWAYRIRSLGDTHQPQKCSTVAVRAPDGAVLIGQNMDIGGYSDGHQIVLRIAPDGERPGALIFSIASMIALFGVNTAGIGVCVNSVAQLPARACGLPVTFMIRKLLQARTLAEAVEHVRSIPHATGQHYAIADANEIRSFEASPEAVVEYHSTDSSILLHTNHPMAEVLVRRYGAGSDNSVTRLQCLQARLHAGSTGLEAVQAALASRDHPDFPVSRTEEPGVRPSLLSGMISFTTGSMISRLTRNAQEIEAWVSPGPPHLHGFTRLSLGSK